MIVQDWIYTEKTKWCHDKVSLESPILKPTRQMKWQEA